MINETIQEWLEDVTADNIDEKIEEARDTISNEHLWELGYEGDEPNPHTDNITTLQMYLEELKRRKRIYG